MHTVHGSHHRSLVRTQDYKQLMKRRQNDILLSTLPEDEYVETTDGRYKCLICSYIPPFTSAESLLSHMKGKKHAQRRMTKLKATNKPSELPTIPETSMAMPSLVYRTNEITKRVIASNHEVSTPKAQVPQILSSPSEEPEWMKKMREERKEREMISKGFKKDEQGNWIRDEIVEFDSDEEPTL